MGGPATRQVPKICRKRSDVMAMALSFLHGSGPDADVLWIEVLGELRDPAVRPEFEDRHEVVLVQLFADFNFDISIVGQETDPSASMDLMEEALEAFAPTGMSLPAAA